MNEEPKLKEGKEILPVWFRRVWKEEDTNAIDEMFAPECRVMGLGLQPLIGPEDFKVFHERFCEIYENINVTIDKCIQEEDWTSALCTMHARIKATGEEVVMTGNVFFRVKDGLIQEGYDHFDFMGLWEQMGYLPLDCFEKGLCGQRIA